MSVKYTNNASTSVAVGITGGDTSLTVTDASSFPAVGGADYCYVTLVSAAAKEVVKVTAIAGNVLTIERAQDNTSAVSFSIGDAAEIRIPTILLQDLTTEASTSANADAVAAAASAVTAGVAETNAVAAQVAAEAAVSSIGWSDVVYVTVADSPINIVDADNGKLYSVDASGGPVLFNLPAISAITLSSNWMVGAKKTDSSGNAISFDGNGTDTIDLAAVKTITSAGSGTTLIPDADPAPDEWTSVDFGATAGNMTFNSFVTVTDYTKDTSTQLTTTVAPGSENNMWVFFDSVYQPQDTFSLAGAVITFNTPIDASKVDILIGTTLTIGTPSDATVSSAKIVDAAVTLAKLEAAAKPYDMAFLAGFDTAHLATDVLVQTYASLTVPRTGTITGDFADIQTAPVGAILLLDIEKNGTSIYTTVPQFADGSTTLTSGVLKTDGTEDFVAGDRFVFKVTQLGSTTAGAGINFTLKGEVA